MRIRNKFILAMAVPVGLMLLQIVLVNLSIRELQTAVEFISAANRVIESNFVAVENVDELRGDVKQIPSRFVSGTPSQGSVGGEIMQKWSALDDRLTTIRNSSVYLTASPETRSAIADARESVATQLAKTREVLDAKNTDLDTLLETAIYAERGLVNIRDTLRDLTVELRRKLEDAVAYEREIHNRPVVAGLVVGGLVILMIIAFAWLYVDGHLVVRLTALSESMLAIAGGNLKAEIPTTKSDDEIGEMAEALTIFRDTAVEVEEDNLRDIANARQRLIDAIESISEGFSLYDSDDLLVISNGQYGELLYPGLQDEVQPGVAFKDIVAKAVGAGLVADADGRRDEWLAERLERHANPQGVFVQRRNDGCWIEVTEHKTTDGGTVAIYADITQQREAERALRDAKDKADQALDLVSQKNAMLESLSAKLSKYLSPQVYSSIFRGDQNVEIASKRKKLTIMFSDIAGFTETTDTLESEELTSLLNNYLNEMSKIALEHGATIDKYIGDAVMLFFGDPESRGIKEDALACVQTAIAMQKKMVDLQRDWQDRGMENPFRLRIGINTGYCTVGNFGSEDRMDYTIVGSEVNLAERLESIAELDTILMSHETRCLTQDHVDAVECEPKSLKGFSKPIRNYEVRGLRTSEEDSSEQLTIELAGVQVMIDDTKMSAEELEKSIATLKTLRSRIDP